MRNLRIYQNSHTYMKNSRKDVDFFNTFKKCFTSCKKIWEIF